MFPLSGSNQSITTLTGKGEFCLIRTRPQCICQARLLREAAGLRAAEAEMPQGMALTCGRAKEKHFISERIPRMAETLLKGHQARSGLCWPLFYEQKLQTAKAWIESTRS